GTAWTRLCTGFGAGALVSAFVSVGARPRMPDAASSRVVSHPLGAVVAWLEVRRCHFREDRFLLRQPGLRRCGDSLLSLLFRRGGTRPAFGPVREGPLREA